MIACKCSGCGKEINIHEHRLKYKHQFCSRECFMENQKITLSPQKKLFETRQCSNCNKDIIRKPHEFGKGKNQYCSRNCYYEYCRKTKVKNKALCFVCGKEFFIKPKEQRERKNPCCSRKCSGIMRSMIYKGENHPKWDETLTDEERYVNRSYAEYYEWRTKVFERDNFTCQCCGDGTGGNLVAHHIMNYSKHKDIRTEVDNGITLCKECHKTFHDNYGYTNNNRGQITEFINSRGA